MVFIQVIRKEIISICKRLGVLGVITDIPDTMHIYRK